MNDKCSKCLLICVAPACDGLKFDLFGVTRLNAPESAAEGILFLYEISIIYFILDFYYYFLTESPFASTAVIRCRLPCK